MSLEFKLKCLQLVSSQWNVSTKLSTEIQLAHCKSFINLFMLYIKIDLFTKSDWKKVKKNDAGKYGFSFQSLNLFLNKSWNNKNHIDLPTIYKEYKTFNHPALKRKWLWVHIYFRFCQRLRMAHIICSHVCKCYYALNCKNNIIYICNRCICSISRIFKLITEMYFHLEF